MIKKKKNNRRKKTINLRFNFNCYLNCLMALKLNVE